MAAAKGPDGAGAPPPPPLPLPLPLMGLVGVVVCCCSGLLPVLRVDVDPFAVAVVAAPAPAAVKGTGELPLDAGRRTRPFELVDPDGPGTASRLSSVVPPVIDLAIELDRLIALLLSLAAEALPPLALLLVAAGVPALLLEEAAALPLAYGLSLRLCESLARFPIFSPTPTNPPSSPSPSLVGVNPGVGGPKLDPLLTNGTGNGYSYRMLASIGVF